MIISFEIPSDIESQLRAEGFDLVGKAREAFLVKLYRDQIITQHQLGQALELDDYETDGLLKRCGVGDALSLEEFEQQRAFLEERVPR